jgi:hypothetical protein
MAKGFIVGDQSRSRLGIRLGNRLGIRLGNRSRA